jgi:hypothetical protein
MFGKTIRAILAAAAGVGRRASIPPVVPLRPLAAASVPLARRARPLVAALRSFLAPGTFPLPPHADLACRYPPVSLPQAPSPCRGAQSSLPAAPIPPAAGCGRACCTISILRPALTLLYPAAVKSILGWSMRPSQPVPVALGAGGFPGLHGPASRLAEKLLGAAAVPRCNRAARRRPALMAHGVQLSGRSMPTSSGEIAALPPS